MRKPLVITVVYTTLMSICATDSASAAEDKASPEITFKVPEKVAAILDNHCYFCHDEDEQKGEIQLDNLNGLDTPKRLDLFNRMQEQVYFKHMPPKKRQQPSEADRQTLLTYLSTELGIHKASTLEGKLQKPEFGNYVDHEKLFSGKYKDEPGFTYDRRWLISKYIFNAQFQRIVENRAQISRNKKRFPVLGCSKIKDLSLANPFLLPTASGVRYYANEDFTGGHLSSMLTNAQKTSEYITNYLVERKKGKYLPAINEIMALDDQHHKTLTSRRLFLETFIARFSDEIYGSKNESLLPTFKPVVLKEVKKLAEGEKYKKAPDHVALSILDKLNGSNTINQFLITPEYEKKSDNELRAMCERIWFYFGDYERDVQGRMTILRDYMPELRARAIKDKRKRIKLLIYKPLADTEMEIIKASILKLRKNGDHYNVIIEKCMADWEKGFEQDRIAAGPPSDVLLSKLVDQLFSKILERAPNQSEVEEYLVLSKSYVAKLGKLKAIQKLIQTFILSSEFSYRQEFGMGEADQHGRRILSPRDASYAIAYALTDQSPDEKLVEAAESGKLNTREDFKREVERILEQRNNHYVIDPVLADKNYNDNSTN